MEFALLVALPIRQMKVELVCGCVGDIFSVKPNANIGRIYMNA